MSGKDAESILVVEVGKLYPIEVKKGKQAANPDKYYSLLGKLGLEVQPGMILCMISELVPYNRYSWYCPTSVL